MYTCPCCDGILDYAFDIGFHNLGETIMCTRCGALLDIGYDYTLDEDFEEFGWFYLESTGERIDFESGQVRPL